MKMLAPLMQVLALVIGVAHAPYQTVSAADWQTRRLLTPAEYQVKDDLSGKVFIYDGLTDKVVNQAMNEQFDRIDAMMFIRTAITNDEGEPITDPKTGEILTEDDDCD